jgi:hypothetical protein
MAHERLKTSRAPSAITVLAVGCSAELVDRCRDVAPTFGAVVKACDLLSASSVAAQLRPAVLVMTEDLYHFDPPELDALARTVGATLVRFSNEEASVEAAELLIGAALSSR